MLSYRVYRLGVGGRIRYGDYLQAADDSEAIELARCHAEDANCELWLGSKKIALFPAGGGTLIVVCHPG
jgi:hypothetical protein